MMNATQTTRQGYVIQLYKKAGMVEHTFPNLGSGIDQQQYYAFGYYDAVNIIPIYSSDDLTLVTRAPSSAVEQVVLMEPSGPRAPVASNPILMASFLMIREPIDNHFELTRQLEIHLRTELSPYDGDIAVNAYVALGASAIGLLFSVSNYNMQAVESALQILRRGYAPSGQHKITYTFSILGFDKNRLKNVPDGERTMLKGVLMSLVNSPETTPKMHRLIEDIKARLKGSDVPHYQVPGADDFCLIQNGVALKDLLALYQDNGILAIQHGGKQLDDMNKEWYGHYCVSVFTTILFGSDAPTEASTTNATKQETAAFPSRLDTELPTELKLAFESLLMDRHPQAHNYLERHIHAFNMLSKSHYTELIFATYASVARQFVKLVEQSLIYDRQVGDVNRIDFFNHLEHTIETMQNTSTYFTDSPGFKPVEDHSFPRLLIAYTTLVNHLAASWNEMTCAYYGTTCRPKPRHRFLLTLHGTEAVLAQKYCRALPPDDRLVRILVPLGLAHQPAALLPLLLHEVGHFIGVRHRVKQREGTATRERYFLRLVSFHILGEARKLCRQEMIRRNPDMQLVSSNALWTSPLATEEEKRTMSQLTRFLSWAQPHLEQELANFYQKRKQEYLDRYETLAANATNTDVDQDLFYRHRASLESGFFDHISITLEHCVACWLPVGHLFFRNLLSAYGQTAWRHHPVAIQRELRTEIDNLIAIAQREMFQQEGLIAEWVSAAKTELTEPAADIFMAQTLGMNCQDYLCLVFEQQMKPSLDRDALLDYLDDMPTKTRLSAVLYAIRPAADRLAPLSEAIIPEQQAACMARIRSRTLLLGGNNEVAVSNFGLFESFCGEVCKLYREFAHYMGHYEPVSADFDPTNLPPKLERWYGAAAHVFNVYNCQLTIAEYIREVYEDTFYLSPRVAADLARLRDLYAAAKDALQFDKDANTGMPSLSRMLDMLFAFLPMFVKDR